MAGSRGDDIVLAGSGGQRASATLSALFDQTHRSTSLILAIDSIIIVLIVLLLIVGVLQFNRLRRLNVQVDGAFAGIDTLLTKRADLIPNLVETVKGAADFEQSTLQAVTDARTSIGQATTVEDTAAADNMLTEALGRLFAVAEAYPQLTATQNYIELQRQLQQVEGELQFARQFYNEAVVQLNTALTTVPGMWFAGVAKVTQRDMYSEPDEDRRDAPSVEF